MLFRSRFFSFRPLVLLQVHIFTGITGSLAGIITPHLHSGFRRSTIRWTANCYCLAFKSRSFSHRDLSDPAEHGLSSALVAAEDDVVAERKWRSRVPENVSAGRHGGIPAENHVDVAIQAALRRPALRTGLRAAGRLVAGLRRAALLRVAAAFLGAALRTDFTAFFFAVFAIWFLFLSFYVPSHCVSDFIAQKRINTTRAANSGPQSLTRC